MNDNGNQYHLQNDQPAGKEPDGHLWSIRPHRFTGHIRYLLVLVIKLLKLSAKAGGRKN
ncbi:MAG TPA: hypothetical protein VK638_30390 [Edaphobacter sp.]|nr:hypothetical protein [Edaphobacter sp.]